MGIKNPKGAISIENFKGRIRLRWRHLGKRYSLSCAGYSKLNLLAAKKLAIQLEQDMLMGCFDQTLGKYKQNSPPKQPNTMPRKKKLIEWFEDWTRFYRQIDFDANMHYYGVRSMVRKWGEIGKEKMLEKLNKEKLGNQTYNERLAILSNFSDWLVKKGIWPFNPLEDVRPKKIKKTAKPNREPFSLEEIKRILEAMKNDTHCPKGYRHPHSHYYPFLYFIFQTGVRNAEAVGLRVGSIDIQLGRIIIKEALARTVKGTHANARVRKETKNGKERILPLTPNLLKVLAPLLEGKGGDDLVFTSPTGLAIDDRMFQRRVFKPVLRALGIKERVLYACRHTFGSRCIQEGINPVVTAFLMGNNPETALRNYTHLIELPSSLPKLGD